MVAFDRNKNQKKPEELSKEHLLVLIQKLDNNLISYIENRKQSWWICQDREDLILFRAFATLFFPIGITIVSLQLLFNHAIYRNDDLTNEKRIATAQARNNLNRIITAILQTPDDEIKNKAPDFLKQTQAAIFTLKNSNRALHSTYKKRHQTAEEAARLGYRNGTFFQSLLSRITEQCETEIKRFSNRFGLSKEPGFFSPSCNTTVPPIAVAVTIPSAPQYEDAENQLKSSYSSNN